MWFNKWMLNLSLHIKNVFENNLTTERWWYWCLIKNRKKKANFNNDF